MEPTIVLEDYAFYHPIAINPSYGKPVRITLDDKNNLTIYKLDDQRQPREMIARITLSDEWIFDGGDATFLLRSTTATYKLDFNPRTSLPSMAKLVSLFSPKYKAAMNMYVKWKEAMIGAGVRVQKHRILLPIVIGVVASLGVLMLLFGGIYLFGRS